MQVRRSALGAHPKFKHPLELTFQDNTEIYEYFHCMVYTFLIAKLSLVSMNLYLQNLIIYLFSFFLYQTQFV